MNELEIYNRIQEGDELALQEIVKANMDDLWPIARSLAKENGKWTPDDLFQEGALAMVRFAQRWIYQEGIPFTVACRQRVRGAMYDFLRRKADTLRGQKEQPLSLDASSTDSPEGRTLGESIGVEEKEEFDLPDSLTTNEREVLERRVLAQFPAKVSELAKELRVSAAHIQRLQKRGMQKLRAAA